MRKGSYQEEKKKKSKRVEMKSEEWKYDQEGMRNSELRLVKLEKKLEEQEEGVRWKEERKEEEKQLSIQHYIAFYCANDTI